MKKQLLGVALSALMLTTVAEAKSFDGGYLGANVGYKWESVKLKETDSASTLTWKPTGVDGSVVGGYGETMGSVYLGGEVRVGYGWGKKKKNFTYNGAAFNLTVKNTWNAGIGVLVGGECTNDCLMFFRLGLDYNNYQLKDTSNTIDLDKKFNTWAVVPGLGVKWKLDKDWYVTGMYEYSHKFAAKKIVADLKVDKLTSHGVKLGVGYQF